MNRLNFSQMVNKTLLNQQKSKKKSTKKETDMNSDKYSDKIKQANERLNLDGKIRDFVFDVHEKLRESQTNKPTQPKIKAKVKAKSKIKPDKEDVRDQLDCDNVSLAHLKVMCNEKHRKCCQNSNDTLTKSISYEQHKRMIKALQRQHEMQNMLNEHKLLQQGRQSLEQDIFAMRHILDDIQHRVNKSLKQLNDNKTYCVCHDLKNTKECNTCTQTKQIE